MDILLNKEKIKMECKTVSCGGEDIGLAIEVNGLIAVTVVYEEDIGVVYCNMFHKDYDKPAASREFLSVK